MKLFLSLYLLTGIASALWPMPKHYEHGNTLLWINSDVEISHNLRRKEGVGDLEQRMLYQIDDDPQSIFSSPENPNHTSNESHTGPPSELDILEAGINRALKTILHHSIHPWKFRPRNWTSPTPDTSSFYLTTITLEHKNKDQSNHLTLPIDEIDESYTLEITLDGKCHITGNSTYALLHGLTTLTQLFYRRDCEECSPIAYTPFAPISITDSPLLSHRGLNLDVSRTWIPLPSILRTITALSTSKLNVLHLHITDSQSWPLIIPSLPLLAKNGAYAPHLTYSVSDFEKIHRYAALHGIHIITEIDMPGHTAAIHHSYPDLIAAYNIQPNWTTYAAEPPSGTLKLNSSAVETFLDTLFADVIPRVAPYTTVFHSGGDEVNRAAYELDDTVKSSDFDVLRPLMQRFVDGVHRRIMQRGLRPVVWEEMVLEWGLDLDKSTTIVQVWRSNEAAVRLVEMGFQVLVGNYKRWYLDCGKGQWLDSPYPPSSSTGDKDKDTEFLDYCAPYHNWRAVYAWDPLGGIPRHLRYLVLGGETHIWGEMTDETNLDGMVWPRAAAAGEVLWGRMGGREKGGGNKEDEEDEGWSSVSRRLSEWRERALELGVGADVVQMPFCTMGEGMCGVPEH